MQWAQLPFRVWLTVIAVIALILPASVHAKTYEVTLEGTSFWYEGMQNLDIDLAIHPGDTIRWLWIQGFHNVVSGFPDDPNTEAGGLFFSGEPTSDAGTVFAFTFTNPGVYGYHCHPHESVGMISSITVVPESGSICLLLIGTAVLLRFQRIRNFRPRSSSS